MWITEPLRHADRNYATASTNVMQKAKQMADPLYKPMPRTMRREAKLAIEHHLSSTRDDSEPRMQPIGPQAYYAVLHEVAEG